MSKTEKQFHKWANKFFRHVLANQFTVVMYRVIDQEEEAFLALDDAEVLVNHNLITIKSHSLYPAHSGWTDGLKDKVIISYANSLMKHTYMHTTAILQMASIGIDNDMFYGEFVCLSPINKLSE